MKKSVETPLRFLQNSKVWSSPTRSASRARNSRTESPLKKRYVRVMAEKNDPTLFSVLSGSELGAAALGGTNEVSPEYQWHVANLQPRTAARETIEPSQFSETHLRVISAQGAQNGKEGLHQCVEHAIENLESCSKLLENANPFRIEIGEVWKHLCQLHQHDPLIQRLNQQCQMGKLNAAQAYFLYTQAGAEKRMSLNAQPTLSSPHRASVNLSKSLAKQENETGEWKEKISEFGDLISFTGVLAHTARGFNRWGASAPQWLSQPALALTHLEQNYRTRLDEMHFSLRMPLEALWTPRHISEPSQLSWMQWLGFSPTSAATSTTMNQAIASWSAVPTVKAISTVGSAAGWMLSGLGAAWGIVCAAASTKVGKMGEEHGAQVFEWGEKFYARWKEAPEKEGAIRAALQTKALTVSEQTSLSPNDQAIDFGLCHLQEMISQFPTDPKFADRKGAIENKKA